MLHFAVTSSVAESDAGDVGRLSGEFTDGGAFDREVVLEAADLFAQLGDSAQQLGDSAQQLGVLREESLDLVSAVLIELA